MSKRKTMPATVPPAIPKFRVVDDPPRDVAEAEDDDAVTDVEGRAVADVERAVADVEGRRYQRKSRSALYSLGRYIFGTIYI